MCAGSERMEAKMHRTFTALFNNAVSSVMPLAVLILHMRFAVTLVKCETVDGAIWQSISCEVQPRVVRVIVRA